MMETEYIPQQWSSRQLQFLPSVSFTFKQKTEPAKDKKENHRNFQDLFFLKGGNNVLDRLEEFIWHPKACSDDRPEVSHGLMSILLEKHRGEITV